jgi:hypothetical protein
VAARGLASRLSDFPPTFLARPARLAAITAALLVLGGNAAVAADRTVYLTVKVKDESGKAMGGARVNVYQEYRTRFRAGVVAVVSSPSPSASPVRL